MKDCLLKHPHLFDMVRDESARQLNKWGIQDRVPFEWLAYIHEESGELAKAISEWTYRDGTPMEVVGEAIQLATLSLKVAEMFLYQLNQEHGLLLSGQ